MTDVRRLYAMTRYAYTHVPMYMRIAQAKGMCVEKLSDEEFVVINTHGSHNSLDYSTMVDNEIRTHLLLNLRDVSNLDYRLIKILILLGCNIGHWGYYDSNIAVAFSNKISGVVWASDGTVSSGVNNFSSGNRLLNVSFRSKTGDGWWRQQWNEDFRVDWREDNFGWIIYSRKNGLKKTGKKSLR